MRIRTITASMNVDPSRLDEQFEGASSFLHGARELFDEEGFEVQTIRLSTQPFGEYLIGNGASTGLGAFIELDRLAGRCGLDHLGIGPAEDPYHIGIIPLILQRTQRTSASCLISTDREGVLEGNMVPASRAVKAISELGDHGIKNFHFSCLGMCPPGVPFFPASYNSGGAPSFSIGLESGEALCPRPERMGRTSIDDLMKGYTKTCVMIERTAMSLKGPEFAGIDTSLNPSISPEGSASLAIERISGAPFGSPGTLAACSKLTHALKGIPVRRTGFCGLMLPVLEDAHLAAMADERDLDLQNLLLYSSVCGTGLDAVPLPGDISTESISFILRDVAHLSWRLNKPLTARLLPSPGERTEFSSPHLINCRVVSP